MNIADITQEAGGHRKRKRVGRGPGSGHGKTAGRGHNGSASRAGAKRFVLREGGQMPTFRRLPKRGFTNVLFARRFSIVNISSLDERFESGAHVTAQALLEEGLVRDLKLPVKILGNGTLTKKLRVDVAKCSGSAREKIEAAGGTVQGG